MRAGAFGKDGGSVSTATVRRALLARYHPDQVGKGKPLAPAMSSSGAKRTEHVRTSTRRTVSTCMTCDIKDPTQNIAWVTPEGGGGPSYPNM
jgi:hypothetical protein